MTRDATGIALDGTKLLVTAGAVEARRLDAHRVDIGARRPKAPRFVLDRLDQLRPVASSPQPLLQPEELYEQDRGPDFADDAADDLVVLSQRDSEAFVFLPPHLVDDVAALLRAVVVGLRQYNPDLLVMGEVIERGDNRPTVHLALVDLLGTVIEARRVAKTDRVC